MSGTRADARKAREVCQGECDALQCERCARAVAAWRDGRAREVLRDALGEVWSGADWIDADAVLDHLRDRGARIEVTS